MLQAICSWLNHQHPRKSQVTSLKDASQRRLGSAPPLSSLSLSLSYPNHVPTVSDTAPDSGGGSTRLRLLELG